MYTRLKLARFSSAIVAVAWITGPPNASGQLVVNGDFQTGVLAPSTTAYAQSANMIAPATWNITDFDTLHPQWVDLFDHTHGDSSGRYMILNGTDQGLGPAWAQTVSVAASAHYKLSAWFATLFQTSPASIELRVFDGATPLASSAYFTPAVEGVWQRHQTSFNSGSATSVSIEIWDTNLQFGGNDYAIDDVSLNLLVPEPATWVGFALAGGAASARRRRVAAERI